MMTGFIKPGFSFHPQWVDRSGLPEFVRPLMLSGLSSLEYELDPSIQDFPKTLGYMEEAVTLGLDMSFHAPYRGTYTLAGFEHGNKEKIISAYAPMLKIAQDWSMRLHKQLVVVIHGAKADTANREALFQDTCEFLRWALVENGDIRLAFENNTVAVDPILKIGDTCQEVDRVVSTVNHPRLGICWDMGHYALAGLVTPPDEAWLKKVIHVHIHDLDSTYTDHFPLVFSSYAYTEWLKLLVSTGMQGIATLEVKGGQLMKWSSDRIEEALASSFKSIKEVGL